MVRSLSFDVAGDPTVNIFVAEQDGKLEFTLTQSSDNGKVADLRGLFFHVNDESLLDKLNVAIEGNITDFLAEEDKVKDLGNGANVNGVKTGPFDVGIEFGRQGIGQDDDIREVTFTLERTDNEDLTLDLIGLQDLAVRLTSVGVEGGPREDSLKLADTFTAAPDAIDDAFMINEDTIGLFNVLANDTDADIDPPDILSIVDVSDPTNGFTSIVTNQAQYIPVTSFVGDDSFMYTIDDGNGGSDWANVDVQVKLVPGITDSLEDIDPLMWNFIIEVPEIPPVLDIMLTQDLSGSFSNDLPQLNGDGGQYGQLYDRLVTTEGLDAQFGIASFIDKPISPFGSPTFRGGDFVYRTDLAITNSRIDLINTVDGLSTRSGADFEEAQLEALQQIGLRAEGEVGYRDQPGDPDDPQRFLVLSTDADFHVAGDFASAGANNGDTILDGTPPGTGEDYPSIAQVKSALQDANIYPIFSVTSNVISTYETLVTQLGFGDVVELTSNSNNLADSIIEALQEVKVDVDPEVVSNTTGLEVELDPDFVADVLSGSQVPLKLTASASNDYRSGTIEIEVNGQAFQTINVDIPVQVLNGSDGRDILTGSNGPDQILAGARADIINAGGGDDLVKAGLGSDTVTLGKGDDIYLLDATLTNAEFFLGSDIITDYNEFGSDTIELKGLGVSDLVVSDDGTDTFISAHSSLSFFDDPLVTLENYTGAITFVEI